MIGRIMAGAIGLFVIFMFIVNFTPVFEADVSSANITNSFTAAMVDMAVWIVPISLIVAGFMLAFKYFKGKGS